MHNVSHRLTSVGALRLALYHELEDVIPDSDDYNLGYFEGKQQKKKWLVSSFNLDAMHTSFEGKQKISLWCDGKLPPDDELESSDEDTGRAK